MRQFNSFAELANHFAQLERRVGPAIVHELDDNGRAVAAAVKRYFGTYGPGWAVLADSTQAERVRLGYSPNDPLLRSGDLQGLINHMIEGESLFVGILPGAKLRDGTSAPMVMASLENGTSDGRIPPRPVFLQGLADMQRFAHAFGLGVAARIWR